MESLHDAHCPQECRHDFANVVLTFNSPTGQGTSVTIAMTYNSTTGVWACDWDSSAAGQGTVFWMVWGYGALQAADEGCFQIEANSANVV
jgi:hypothetical protein